MSEGDAPDEASGRYGNGWVILEGERYRLIPYGGETDGDGVDVFATPCHRCGAEPGARHSEGCSMGEWNRRPPFCRDCGTPIGELHAMECVIEDCPCCGGQYVACECVGSEDEDYEDHEAR